MLLRGCYEMSGTDVGYAATREKQRLASWGEVAASLSSYALDTQCPVLAYAMLLHTHDAISGTGILLRLLPQKNAMLLRIRSAMSGHAGTKKRYGGSIAARAGWKDRYYPTRPLRNVRY
eukprot:2392480-Rhodomonas_salina.2